jgi:anti-sigma B factor antagonist
MPQAAYDSLRDGWIHAKKGNIMQMQVEDGDHGVFNIALSGRLDTAGVSRIETRLTAQIVPRGARAIIDLSQVDFVGSLAIRMFITIARAAARNGGKLALYGAQPPVAQVFETTSLNDIVPVRADAASAAAMVHS